MTARIFVAVVQHGPHVRELVTEIVPDVFPWVVTQTRRPRRTTGRHSHRVGAAIRGQ